MISRSAVGPAVAAALVGGFLSPALGSAQDATARPTVAIQSLAGDVGLSYAGGPEVTLVLRSPEELPLEFSSWPNRPPHVDVLPHEREFDDLATLTRRLPLADLGIDPTIEPVPLGVLAILGPDGTWKWVDNAGFVLDIVNGTIELSGSIAHGGRVFAFISGALAVDMGIVLDGRTGDTVSTEAMLVISPASDAAMTELNGMTFDPTVAIWKQALHAFEEPIVMHQFDCVAPGVADIETAYDLEGYGDDNPLANSLGLGGASVEVRVRSVMTCEA